MSVWELCPLKDEAFGACNARVGRRHAIINNLLGSKPGVYYLDQLRECLNEDYKSLPRSRVREQSAPLRGVRDHAARSFLARAYHVGPSRR